MKTETAQYAYAIERYNAGAGRSAWRWTINDGESGAVVVRGVSLQSHEAAEHSVLQEIARRRAARPGLA